MVKRMFQVIDEMNHEDSLNDTTMVFVSGSMKSANMGKEYGVISMYITREEFMNIMNGDKTPILVVFDRNKYKKRKEN